MEQLHGLHQNIHLVRMYFEHTTFLQRCYYFIKHSLNVQHHSIGINTLFTVSLDRFYFTIFLDCLFMNLSMSTIVSLLIALKKFHTDGIEEKETVLSTHGCFERVTPRISKSCSRLRVFYLSFSTY